MRDEIKEVEKVWKQENERLIKERNALLLRIEELESQIKSMVYDSPNKKQGKSKRKKSN